jgi:hypothetical protein
VQVISLRIFCAAAQHRMLFDQQCSSDGQTHAGGVGRVAATSLPYAQASHVVSSPCAAVVL